MSNAVGNNPVQSIIQKMADFNFNCVNFLCFSSSKRLVYFRQTHWILETTSKFHLKYFKRTWRSSSAWRHSLWPSTQCDPIEWYVADTCIPLLMVIYRRISTDHAATLWRHRSTGICCVRCRIGLVTQHTTAWIEIGYIVNGGQLLTPNRRPILWIVDIMNEFVFI